jgi:signal transduction histidine kinase
MMKILVIEDETGLRQEIVDVLYFEGYDAIGAADGQEGIELAKQILPDLIICDIMMPKVDGYGVLMTLRDDPATADIPFIFLTAKASRHDWRTGMNTGADDYLTKPFEIEELLAAVRSRLTRHGAIVETYEDKLQQMRGAIVSTLPHELRTPLTGILGFTEILLDEIGTTDIESIREMLQNIWTAGQRLYRLIENYLLYAQIEIAGLNPDKQEAIQQFRLLKPASPKVQVSFVADEKAAEYARTGDLTLDLADAAIQISVDDFGRIVEELIDNAFKFSTPGTPVTIKGEALNNLYHLRITDAGRGMSAGQIKTLGAFTQFERRIYEQQGSGLGLIIAKRLAELHDGRLTLISEIDKGTTVSVHFLLSGANQERRQSASRPDYSKA